MPGGAVRTQALRCAALVVAAVAALAGCAAEPPVLAPQADGPVRYVALGDSSAAGPLTGPLVGPLGCARSQLNYPHLVAAAVGARQLVDVSCGDATLEHLGAPQQTQLLGIPMEVVPPQFDAVTPDTDLITVGLGGNDVGLPGVATGCINITTVPLGPPPFGQSCIPSFQRDGADVVSGRIADLRTTYATRIATLQRLAPRARILVVNYMAAAPPGDTGCFPTVPVLDGDLVYVRSKLEELNAAIADVAREAGVGLVDLYAASIGHDMCQGPGTRWMNALSWDSPGIALHANRSGHEAFARVIADAVRPAA